MKNLNYGQDHRELVDMNVRIAMDGEEPHLIDERQEVLKLGDDGVSGKVKPFSSDAQAWTQSIVL